MDRTIWYKILADYFREEPFKVLPFHSKGEPLFEVWKWWPAPAKADIVVNADALHCECIAIIKDGSVRTLKSVKMQFSLADPELRAKLTLAIVSWLHEYSHEPRGKCYTWGETLEYLCGNSQYDLHIMGHDILG